MYVAKTSRFTRIKESLSQILCVLLVNGDADEMLSSYAWRTKNTTLIYWLDKILGKNHCKESYDWEREHYDVDRFPE